MKKRVVIIHGWKSSPNLGWLAWISKQLKTEGFEVIAPHFIYAKMQSLGEAIEELGRLVGKLDKNTVFIGHSMGCPVILRYLSEYSDEAEIAGVVLVAGFYEPKDGRHQKYFGQEPDFEKLKKMINKSLCIYSDNDMAVRPQRSKEMAEALDAEQIEVSGARHFGHREDVGLPQALDAVLSCYNG